jgi:fucose 4-O-acetylase-like acetyltransferase
MPLFFFISGYLFSFRKYDCFKSFVRHRSRQLVVPYVSFNIITYIFWLFIGHKFGDDATRNIPFYKPLIGIVYGNGINDFLVHDIASWFLACLFVVETLFFLSFSGIEKTKSVLLLLCFAIIGYIDYSFDSIRWPWSLNVALVAMVFYGFGNVFKAEIDRFLAIKTKHLIVTLLIIVPLFLMIVTINGAVDLNSNYYNHYWLFFPGAFLGIYITAVLSRVFEVFFGQIHFIQFISGNTLIILVFQFLAMSLIKAFTLFVLKVPLSVFENKVALNVFVSVLVMIILSPLMFILPTYFPFLLGKKKGTTIMVK